MFQESQPSGSSQSGVRACGQHVAAILHLGGWGGVLVSTEQLKDMHQIVIYILSGGTGSPVTLWSSSVTA